MYKYITFAIIIGIAIYVYSTIRAEGFQNQAKEPITKESLQKVVEYFNRLIKEKKNSTHSTIRQYIPKLLDSVGKLNGALAATPGDDSTLVHTISMQEVYNMHVVADMIKDM